MFIKGHLTDPVFHQKQNELDRIELYERFGVLSLTANPRNVTMWEEYAKGFSGICIGFNSGVFLNDKTKFSSGRKVCYYELLPLIFPPVKFPDTFLKQIYSKLKGYSFEEEYRVTLMSDEPLQECQRKVIMPPSSYAEIILGESMPEENCLLIAKLCKEKGINIKLKKAIKKVNKVELIAWDQN